MKWYLLVLGARLSQEPVCQLCVEDCDGLTSEYICTVFPATSWLISDQLLDLPYEAGLVLEPSSWVGNWVVELIAFESEDPQEYVGNFGNPSFTGDSDCLLRFSWTVPHDEASLTAADIGSDLSTNGWVSVVWMSQSPEFGLKIFEIFRKGKI